MTPPEPTFNAIDSAQAVFGALDTFLAASPYVTATAGVTLDGSGTTHTMTCSDRATNSNSFQYTERIAGTKVSIVPTMASLGAGETMQFTATATDSTGAAIPTPTFTWALSGAMAGTIDATGLYTAPATVPAAMSDTVTATATDQQSWASVTIQIHV
jgi:hypothetical protein